MSPSLSSALDTTSKNDTSPPYKGVKKRRVRTESQLARKREIDRRSQHHVRHRNKEMINTMSQKVADLQQNLNKVTRAIEDMQSYITAMHNNSRRRSSFAEVFDKEFETDSAARPASVSKSMEQSRYRVETGPPLNHLPNQCALAELGNALDHHSRLASSCYASSVIRTHDCHQLMSLSTPSPFGSPLPNSLNPASPSITNTIEAYECFSTCSFNVLSRAHVNLLKDFRSKQCIPQSPSLASMLLLDIESNPVVAVIGCSFRHCSPLNVPDSMATYFIMYRLLRWRVHPDPASYEDVPVWYRPSSIQESMPHCLSFDFWAWPKLRDALLSGNHNYCKTKFNMDMCENITIGWPEGKPLIMKSRCDALLQVNPEFEAHVMRYENWKVRKAWAGIYPELVGFVNVAEE